jgi:hypothetical protein
MATAITPEDRAAARREKARLRSERARRMRSVKPRPKARKRQCLMLESGTTGEVSFVNRLFRFARTISAGVEEGRQGMPPEPRHNQRGIMAQLPQEMNRACP